VELGRHPLAPARREPSADDRDGAVGPAHLQAHQQRQSAADEQEDDGREDELDADDLVIFGKDVFPEEAQLRVGVRMGFMRMADAHALHLAGVGPVPGRTPICSKRERDSSRTTQLPRVTASSTLCACCFARVYCSQVRYDSLLSWT